MGRKFSSMRPREFVAFCMERYYQAVWAAGYLQFNPWPLLPSTVTEADLDREEQKLGISFPPLFRAFLSTYFHRFGTDTHALVPDQPPDGPFSGLESVFQPVLARHSYLPFAYDECSDLLVCLDVQSLTGDADGPVVGIGLEYLESLPESAISRDTLEAHCEPISPTFQHYLMETFSLQNL